jgi:A/G-specific adenine glycosylase
MKLICINFYFSSLNISQLSNWGGKLMKFGLIIRGWYKKNKRDLPMRATRDPYKIWVSEIVMQQTRMNQGLPYYLRFIEAFPTVADLAAAPEDAVLKLWQGLGYYSRARNLQGSARYIVEHLGGEMPGDFKGLLKLKGVGKYTAAAIASICYDEPCAAVDGNVSRVISRLYGVEDAVNSTTGARQIEALAGALLDRKDPGMHNQAMIDFGAMQCVPSSPQCTACPLAQGCHAYLSGRVDLIPVKIPKQSPEKRWFYFYIIIYKGKVFLTKRGEKDIWRSLYQFPVLESETPLPEEELVSSLVPATLVSRLHKVSLSAPLIHPLTHRTIHARFIHLEVSSLPKSFPPGWIHVSLQNLDNYPVPRLIHKYLESVKF